MAPESKSKEAQPIVLCADGSPEILEICQAILKAGGYQVFTASNGAEALESLKLHSVNAAVIADRMSDIDGIELARKIKRVDKTVVVVMQCNALSEFEKFPCVDSCISKGKGPIALRKLITSLLQR
jgi:two-component system alkaline phosphatase synthesis response regulator PhoP